MFTKIVVISCLVAASARNIPQEANQSDVTLHHLPFGARTRERHRDVYSSEKPIVQDMNVNVMRHEPIQGHRRLADNHRPDIEIYNRFHQETQRGRERNVNVTHSDVPSAIDNAKTIDDNRPPGQQRISEQKINNNTTKPKDPDSIFVPIDVPIEYFAKNKNEKWPPNTEGNVNKHNEENLLPVDFLFKLFGKNPEHLDNVRKVTEESSANNNNTVKTNQNNAAVTEKVNSDLVNKNGQGQTQNNEEHSSNKVTHTTNTGGDQRRKKVNSPKPDEDEDKWIWSDAEVKKTTTIKPASPQDVELDNRTAFDGGSCPTGQTKFNGACIDND